MNADPHAKYATTEIRTDVFEGDAPMGFLDSIFRRKQGAKPAPEGTVPPTATASADAYIQACFESTFNEQPDDRVWYEVEGLEALNHLVYEGRDPNKALAMTIAALTKHPDYHALYIWLGAVRCQLKQPGQPQATYLEGLQQCRKKASLCLAMGDAEFEDQKLAEAVKWWIRACVLRYKEPFPYVNLAYIAEGLGLRTAHEALLRKADSLPGQTVRFNANGTNARHRLAAAQGNDSIKKAINQLCESYL